jgi:endoglucanase
VVSVLAEVLNSQNPAGRLRSEAVGCRLSVGRKLKTEIPAASIELPSTRFSRSANAGRAAVLRFIALAFLFPTALLAPRCGGGGVNPPASNPVTPGAVVFPLHTSGRYILDAESNRVRLKAFNWYGAEGPDHVVGGLAFQSLDSIAAQLHGWGFNAVRLLWSNQMYESNPVVADNLLAANPNLVGMHALDILDRVVATLGANHLMVILDNHVSDAIWCCTDTDGDGLWYNAAYPESRWLSDWQAMAQRYASQPYVIGADLRNELRCSPTGGANLCATWGGDPSTDWHAAAERGGNAALTANPNLLVFVEGTNYAGDLSGVASQPVQLSVPKRVVYEAHNYGFFYSSNPLKGYDDWVSRINPGWGYLATGSNAQPLWVGEFGTCNSADTCVTSTSNADLGFWFQIITRYIQSNSLDWCYWPANGTNSNYPNAGRVYGSVETYGILNAAWTGPSLPSLLSQLQELMLI